MPENTKSKSANSGSGGANRSKKSAASAATATPLSRTNYSLFFNRELSWLQFNKRVMEEAARRDNPWMERLKFLSIFESNSIEFFMIRVAGLKQIVASSIKEIQIDGSTPDEALQEISRQTQQTEQTLARHVREVFAGLESHGLIILESFKDLTQSEKKFAEDYFNKNLFRILTPLAIDPSHPFPHIANNRLNLAVTLRRKDARDKNVDSYAVVEVPNVMPRFIELPARARSGQLNQKRFIPLEEIIKLNAQVLFSGTTVKSLTGFSILRNSDISIDEVASDNLLSTIEDELKNRRWGEAVRLTYRAGMPENIREFLRGKLDLEPNEIYERDFMLNLNDLMQMYSAIENPALFDKPFIPHSGVKLEHPKKIFAAIRKQDILLHHPYQSFQTVVDFLAIAARDPKTLAIKQTLYRAGRDSPIVQSLIEAAENGKQVTALVELKARFDEERNITWARAMEDHGIHVVYGLVGLKIHGKMLQVVRQEADGVRAYAHLGTGNYNPVTAKLYTDMSLFTADPEINNDVTNLFHTLTGYATLPKLSKIAAAPINLRETLVKLINKEISNAESGKPAGIDAKMNSLVDPDMIVALYRASRAGVKIRLNVRGICCLRPGLPGVSENIQVDSIVGRYLEHSRVFCFTNAGNPRIFMASADWMPRNLNRRVEIMFPIVDQEHIQTILKIMDVTFKDNHNRRQLQSDGGYVRVRPAAQESRFSSQRFFREEADKIFDKEEKDRRNRRKTIFQPLTNPDRGVPEDLAADIAKDESDSDGIAGRV
ncbi:MAG: polyphosphate kinase 1 [bacterium]|nr:polyphosphate kinase 1 [bacterium]